MLSIEEAQAYLEEIAQQLPEVFFENLNGGILLLPDTVLSPEAIEDDLYVLGEYCEDPLMGCYINIYYGSFENIFEYACDDEIREEMRETLLHEFTHHLESLAGERGLEIQDEWDLAQYFQDHEQEIHENKKH